MGLDTVELILTIEEEFGLDIPNEDGAIIETAGALSDYVQSRLERARGRPFGDAEAAMHWERVRAIIAGQIAVNPDIVLRDSNFVRDLGLD